ncbi:hypothetical protein [Dyadobacter sp. NIV53]|uniref:hypothetical protein n=1 Tax=Dyadobacter sp. NIV53 TaxID=2861765 RepID=UPI001C86C953|nr:hypothetical protein [Dyadobacter sp. NIV53]
MGINSEGAEKLLPDLYPVILQSSNFGIFLLEQPVIDQDNHSYKSLKLFLQRDTTQSFFSKLFSRRKSKKTGKPVKLSNPEILSLSATETGNIKGAIGLINSTIDQKIGVVTISADTEDPFVSSILVEAAKNYLVNYVEEYRTAKALQQVVLLKDQVSAAKARLKKSEYSLQSL